MNIRMNENVQLSQDDVFKTMGEGTLSTRQSVEDAKVTPGRWSQEKLLVQPAANRT